MTLTAQEQADAIDEGTLTASDTEAASESAEESAPSETDTDAAPAPEAESPAAEEGAKEPETPEQKEAREKEEQLAQRFKLVESAKKQHLANSKKEAALVQREQQLAAREAQFQTRLQAAEREIADARRYSALVQEVRTNPTLEGLQALGFDYRQLTQQFVEANTPEAAARAANQRVERLERQAAERERIAAERSDAQNLVRLLESDEKTYEDALVYFSPEEMAAEGLALKAAFERAHKQSPTYGWVAQQLQARAKAAREEQQARSARRAGGTRSENGTAAPSNGNGSQANESRNGKATAALSSGSSSTRSSPAREMTEAEKDSWALEQLRALKPAAGARK